jgi:hypothetical protein
MRYVDRLGSEPSESDALASGFWCGTQLKRRFRLMRHLESLDVGNRKTVAPEGLKLEAPFASGKIWIIDCGT